MNRILSAVTVASTGLTCKIALSLGCNVHVKGLHHLLDALDGPDRSKGRGVVTVANHISVCDDPLAWGILPSSSYISSWNTRWALGASDIMFTNPCAHVIHRGTVLVLMPISPESAFSAFFRKGQVLETFRGQGIYQPAVDTAIEKLNRGSWVHLFGEGKVNQPPTYPITNGIARLPRFKWGTGRIIMETSRLPIVIPMWLTGFDTLMPEPRNFPKFLPRFFPRKTLSITFGEPMSPSALESILDRWRARVLPPSEPAIPLGEDDAEKCRVRSEITDLIQRELEALGRSASGPLLG